MSFVQSITHRGHRQLRWLDSPDPCHSGSEHRELGLWIALATN